MDNEAKCPVTNGNGSGPTGGTSNHDWWPNQLDLGVLRHNSPQADPMGDDFDYAE